MDTICYERKVVVAQKQQVIIFVESIEEAFKTTDALRHGACGNFQNE